MSRYHEKCYSKETVFRITHQDLSYVTKIVANTSMTDRTDIDLYEFFVEKEKEEADDERKNNDSCDKKETRPNCRCTVCLCELENEIVRTPCGHSYHKSCIEQAYLAIGSCPNCRQHIPHRWLHRNGIAIRMTSDQYWTHVRDELLPQPPEIGPMLPSHQRWYDQIHGISDPPSNWTRQWIDDRIVEMRIRFNIPPDMVLDANDVRICENNGIRGIQPEWTIPSWVDSD